MRNYPKTLRVLVVGAVFAAACGSGASNHATSRAAIIVGATEHTDSARFETSIGYGEGKPSKIVFDGAVDFTHNVGVRRVRDKNKSFETRVIGTIEYSNNADHLYPLPRDKQWVKRDDAQLTATSPCGGTASASAGQAVGFGVGFGGSPTAVLDQLRTRGVALVRLGTSVVRGTAVTHWRVARPHIKTCGKNTSVFGHTRADIEIWTDGKDRLRRSQWRVTSTVTPSELGGKHPRPITTTSGWTTDVFDFGAHVAVTAPPASEVADETPMLVAQAKGPGKVTGNAWREIAHGTVREKPWQLWFAITTTGWECVDPVGVPRTGIVSISSQQPPRHDGHATWCAPTITGFEVPPFTVVVDGTDGGRHHLVGIAPLDASRVVVRFADKTSLSLPVDAANGLVRWEGAAAPKPVSVTANGVTCTVDAQWAGIGARPNVMLCRGAVGDFAVGTMSETFQTVSP
jgi:hypothetical protein